MKISMDLRQTLGLPAQAPPVAGFFDPAQEIRRDEFVAVWVTVGQPHNKYTRRGRSIHEADADRGPDRAVFRHGSPPGNLPELSSALYPVSGAFRLWPIAPDRHDSWLPPSTGSGRNIRAPGPPKPAADRR